MNTVFIYVLKCPMTGDIRYIGKAKRPHERYLAHLEKDRAQKTHKANWIQWLRARGQKPILEIIDEVLDIEWPSLEAAYIQFFREQGVDLVNSTEGGDAPPLMIGEKNPSFGKPKSAEQRAKISAALLGKPVLEATRKKMSAAKLGRKHSDEARANMSAAQLALGKKLSPETIAKRTATRQHNFELNRVFGKIYGLTSL